MSKDACDFLIKSIRNKCPDDDDNCKTTNYNSFISKTISKAYGEIEQNPDKQAKKPFAIDACVNKDSKSKILKCIQQNKPEIARNIINQNNTPDEDCKPVEVVGAPTFSVGGKSSRKPSRKQIKKPSRKSSRKQVKKSSRKPSRKQIKKSSRKQIKKPSRK